MRPPFGSWFRTGRVATLLGALAASGFQPARRRPSKKISTCSSGIEAQRTRNVSSDMSGQTRNVSAIAVSRPLHLAEVRRHRGDVRVRGRTGGHRIGLERRLARRPRLLVPVRDRIDDLLAGVERPELRIARAEEDRVVELAQPFLGSTGDAEELAEERTGDRQARIQLDRPAQRGDRALRVARHRARERAEDVAVGLHRVAHDRALRMLGESGEVRTAIVRPVLLHESIVGMGEMRMGEAGRRIELDRAGEQRDGLLAVFAGRSPDVPEPAQRVVPRGHVGRRLAHRPFGHALEQLGPQGDRDRLRDLVAGLEGVLERRVPAVGPEMPHRLGVHQLGSDPHAFADLAAGCRRRDTRRRAPFRPRDPEPAPCRRTSSCGRSRGTDATSPAS